MKINKKSLLFDIALVAIAVTMMTSLFITLQDKTHALGKPVGEKQINLLQTYGKAENKLFTLDEAAKSALRKTIYELNKNAGMSKKENTYAGYALWNSPGKTHFYYNQIENNLLSTFKTNFGSIKVVRELFPKLNVENYDFIVKGKLDLIGITPEIATETIYEDTRRAADYAYKPNFNVHVDLDLFANYEQLSKFAADVKKCEPFNQECIGGLMRPIQFLISVGNGCDDVDDWVMMDLMEKWGDCLYTDTEEGYCEIKPLEYEKLAAQHKAKMKELEEKYFTEAKISFKFKIKNKDGKLEFSSEKTTMQTEYQQPAVSYDKDTLTDCDFDVEVFYKKAIKPPITVMEETIKITPSCNSLEWEYKDKITLHKKDDKLSFVYGYDSSSSMLNKLKNGKIKLEKISAPKKMQRFCADFPEKIFTPEGITSLTIRFAVYFPEFKPPEDVKKIDIKDTPKSEDQMMFIWYANKEKNLDHYNIYYKKTDIETLKFEINDENRELSDEEYKKDIQRAKVNIKTENNYITYDELDGSYRFYEAGKAPSIGRIKPGELYYFSGDISQREEPFYIYILQIPKNQDGTYYTGISAVDRDGNERREIFASAVETKDDLAPQALTPKVTTDKTKVTIEAVWPDESNKLNEDQSKLVDLEGYVFNIYNQEVTSFDPEKRIASGFSKEPTWTSTLEKGTYWASVTATDEEGNAVKELKTQQFEIKP